MSLRPTLAICIPALALALGCPTQKTAGPDQDEAPESTAAAEVDGKTVTVAEVDEWIKQQLFDQATDKREPTKLYELRSRVLDEMIDERLLEKEAAPLGLTPDELVRKETEEQISVGDEELLAFYEENKERMGDVAFEEVKPRIQRHLQQQQQLTAGKEYLQALRARGLRSRSTSMSRESR